MRARNGVTLDIPAGHMAGVRRVQARQRQVLGGNTRIAYMPQGLWRNRYPTPTVTDNLDFFGRLFGQP
ncbi:MAG: hypothetical protein WAT09_04025 [Paracoccaceae bacterium]